MTFLAVKILKLRKTEDYKYKKLENIKTDLLQFIYDCLF